MKLSRIWSYSRSVSEDIVARDISISYGKNQQVRSSVFDNEQVEPIAEVPKRASAKALTSATLEISHAFAQQSSAMTNRAVSDTDFIGSG
jgi:hypothetical protein